MASVYEAVLGGDIDALHAFEPSLILDAIWLADIEPSNRAALANTLFTLISTGRTLDGFGQAATETLSYSKQPKLLMTPVLGKRQIRITPPNSTSSTDSTCGGRI